MSGRRDRPGQVEISIRVHNGDVAAIVRDPEETPYALLERVTVHEVDASVLPGPAVIGLERRSEVIVAGISPEHDPAGRVDDHRLSQCALDVPSPVVTQVDDPRFVHVDGDVATVG